MFNSPNWKGLTDAVIKAESSDLDLVFSENSKDSENKEIRGVAKQLLAVEFAKKAFSIPNVPSPVSKSLLGLVIDGVVFCFNLIGGHKWIETIKLNEIGDRINE